MKNLGHIYDQERILEEYIERRIKQAKLEVDEQISQNLRKMGFPEEDIKKIMQVSS